MSKRYLLFGCFLVIVFLCSMFIGQIHKQPASENRIIPAAVATFPDTVLKMRGVSWVAGDSVTEEQILNLKQHQIEWISQTPFGWQTAFNLPDIRMNTQSARAYWGESDAGIIHTTLLAKKYNIKTLLKPHLWLRDQSGKWLGDIQMTNAAQWDQWFRNYRSFILHYAQLAEKEKIEALCIGTELHQAAVTQEKAWRELIRDIRKVYSGQLTYAANWYLEYEQIKFWDALDFIGVQAYFPLTKNKNPTLKELKAGWAKPISNINKIARKYKKPVVFTEAGYKSTTDAAIEPWAWPQRGGIPAGTESYETQVTCYEALFQSVWHQPWFSGMFIWKWYPRLRGNGRETGDFTPQNKPAEKILAEWYGK